VLRKGGAKKNRNQPVSAGCEQADQAHKYLRKARTRIAWITEPCRPPRQSGQACPHGKPAPTCLRHARRALAHPAPILHRQLGEPPKSRLFYRIAIPLLTHAVDNVKPCKLETN
jgi:hypothetical protein